MNLPFRKFLLNVKCILCLGHCPWCWKGWEWSFSRKKRKWFGQYIVLSLPQNCNVYSLCWSFEQFISSKVVGNKTTEKTQFKQAQAYFSRFCEGIYKECSAPNLPFWGINGNRGHLILYYILSTSNNRCTFTTSDGDSKCCYGCSTFQIFWNQVLFWSTSYCLW